MAETAAELVLTQHRDSVTEGGWEAFVESILMK